MVLEGNLIPLVMLWDILTERCLELITCISVQHGGDLKCVAIFSRTLFPTIRNTYSMAIENLKH